MKKLWVVFILLICIKVSFSQSFIIQMSPCDSLNFAGEYNKAIDCYKKNEMGAPLTIRQLATCYAQLSNADSSLKYLNKWLEMGNVELTILDMEIFESIKTTPGWKEFEQKTIKLYKETNPDFNFEYYKKLISLRSIYLENSGKIINEKYSKGESEKTDSLRISFSKINFLLLDTIEKYIDKYGWPYTEMVGSDGAYTVAKIILSTKDPKILKKYYPYLQTDVRNGNLNNASVAAEFEDMILIADNKKQKYGSQAFYNEKLKKFEFYPIEDIANINQRRNEANFFQNFEDFAKYIGADIPR